MKNQAKSKPQKQVKVLSNGWTEFGTLRKNKDGSFYILLNPQVKLTIEHTSFVDGEEVNVVRKIDGKHESSYVDKEGNKRTFTGVKFNMATMEDYYKRKYSKNEEKLNKELDWCEKNQHVRQMITLPPFKEEEVAADYDTNDSAEDELSEMDGTTY